MHFKEGAMAAAADDLKAARMVAQAKAAVALEAAKAVAAARTAALAEALAAAAVEIEAARVEAEAKAAAATAARAALETAKTEAMEQKPLEQERLDGSADAAKKKKKKKRKKKATDGAEGAEGTDGDDAHDESEAAEQVPTPPAALPSGLIGIESAEQETPIDPTLKGLMEDAFGPASDGSRGDRMERGLEAAAGLADPERHVVQWLDEIADNPTADKLSDPRLCFCCGAEAPRSHCSRCGVASYCNKACQSSDWGNQGRWGGHKTLCSQYQQLGKAQAIAPDRRRAVLEATLARLRLYVCPFALCHGSGGESGKPRGCVFVQLGCSLATLALPAPRDCSGRVLAADERAALIHFISGAELDEVCQTDVRIAALKERIDTAIRSHDDRQYVCVLARAACGFTALLLQPMVPAWNVARTLASEYERQECLQINLDVLDDDEMRPL